MIVKIKTFNFSTDVFEILKSSVNVSSAPYNSYGQFIANELRKYDVQTLAMVKESFSDIFFKADMGLLSYTNHQAA